MLSSVVARFSQLLLAITQSAEAAPLVPEAVRKKAQEIVARPEYQLDQGLDDESEALWLTVLSWILKPFIWLFESLDGLPMAFRLMVVILLSVLLVVLIVHMFWSLAAAMRGTKPDVLAGMQQRQRELDPRELERYAETAAAEGHYLEAIRHLFRAALIRIEQSEKQKFRVGITNREVLRRYRKTPLLPPLSELVDLVDRKWYGKEDCDNSDYELCQSRHATVCDVLQRRRHAVGA